METLRDEEIDLSLDKILYDEETFLYICKKCLNELDEAFDSDTIDMESEIGSLVYATTLTGVPKEIAQKRKSVSYAELFYDLEPAVSYAETKHMYESIRKNLQWYISKSHSVVVRTWQMMFWMYASESLRSTICSSTKHKVATVYFGGERTNRIIHPFEQRYESYLCGVLSADEKKYIKPVIPSPMAVVSEYMIYESIVRSV